MPHQGLRVSNETQREMQIIKGEALVRWLELIAQDNSLPPQSARLAIMIAVARDLDGVARFRVKEMAAKMAVSYSGAYDTQRALLNSGYLKGEGVRNRGCLYSLVMPALAQEGAA